MFGIEDSIMGKIQEMLLGLIQTNLEAMFLDINDKVTEMATEVGKTPQGWNSEVFNFIKSINDTVIIPIAGLILTAVLCIELIQLVTEKNNMHSDADTFEFFKYVIKMWIAVWLASHAFTFSMAVFDVGQHLVTQAAGVINISSKLDSSDIVAMVSSLEESSPGGKHLASLLAIAVETSLVKISVQIVAIIVFVITYGRMIEICIYSSVSAIPFATMGNKEWGQIGNNYIKGLFALGLQGLFLMICLGIYSVLIKTVQVGSDIHESLFGVLGYTVLLAIMMTKSGSISKSLMNAH